MSGSGQTPEAEAPVQKAKLSNRDPSLLLERMPRINKKFIRVTMAVFAGVCMIAVILAYQPRRERAAKAGDGVDENGGVVIRRPGDLTVTAEDYLPPSYDDGQVPPEAEAAGTVPDGTPAAGDYQTYDRRPRSEVQVRESPLGGGPLIGQDGQPGTTDGGGYRSPRERRSIFYNALPVAITAVSREAAQAVSGGQGQNGSQGYAPSLNTAVLEQAYASDYQKQNMNSAKEEYLRNAQSQQDFSSYLETMYLPPFDPLHEIKAGTFIPITLVSSIHSDLPGPIEAQVIENVYDSYAGRNVLIPRGTRMHGDYSSSVAFGQDRVLIVWQRMTLPDGVSVNLQGMQGVDLRGMSGLADMVDYHLKELMIAVGVSTAWDLGKAAAVSAMSTVDVLKSINDVLTAQGSASVSANSAMQQIVTNYAAKILNQQPTIVIREGIRGNVFVSKDIILPAYGVF
ncbi:MAG: TrbI/VirB10 family protein [Treponema sp.]|jgi:type IV secretion system protein VirB10|nr:TrbI/VirB10 family protein [Treponema sp.]